MNFIHKGKINVNIQVACNKSLTILIL